MLPLSGEMFLNPRLKRADVTSVAVCARHFEVVFLFDITFNVSPTVPINSMQPFPGEPDPSMAVVVVHNHISGRK